MFDKKKIFYFFSFMFIGVPILKVLLNLYPNFLWFNHLGFSSVWLFVFLSKWKVFLFSFLVSFLWLILHHRLSFIFAKKAPPLSEFDIKTPFVGLNQFLQQFMASSKAAKVYQNSSFIYGWFLTLVILVIALIFGFLAQASWSKIYVFLNQVPFNITDPVFLKDISFYMFSLPFYESLYSWFFMLCVVSFGFVLFQYFTRHLVFSFFTGSSKHRFIKSHIFFFLFCFTLLFTWKFYLNIFNLLYSVRGAVFGAGYTDLVFLLPVLKGTVFLMFGLATILLIWGFLKNIKFPLFLFVIILLFYFLGATVVPSLVQNYVVIPNELQKEKPYIKHNIEFTRKAYGLDRVVEEEFYADYRLSSNVLKSNKTTIDNIRLWNQEPLQQTFSQLQEIRLYYEFYNIDVDRYLINGVPQQVMLSPREMDPLQLPSQAQTWINKHLVYTHGYGVCMSPVNQISKEGLPKYFIKDIPPKSSIDLDVTRPEIYFGEKTNNYIIVNTKQQEFDYPKGDTNVYTSYKGDGGIVLDSLLKKMLYAFKFSDVKILISSLITSESRLMYDRNIKKMVQILAPFLSFDRDPYMIVTKSGQLLWMLDAYTLSDRYPYSEPYKNYFNYIRNSVKVTIDAYTGKTNFYITDVNDPIIQTYSLMYKDMFKPFDLMPDDVKAHIRYPKDLFTVQSEMYSTYHMTDTQVFYNREDLWAIPNEQYGQNEQVMKPYYMVTKLPGDLTESFIQMIPFNPTNKNNMIAWMSVKCDPSDYGDLKVFKFPKDKTIYGPMQIESRIDQDTDISQKLTLWGQLGSRVIRGNLMVVPIESSLIYVEPIYLQATQSKLPELKRVIFAYQDQIVMSDTLNNALNEVFLDTDISFDDSVVSLDVDESDSNSVSFIQRLYNQYQAVKQSFKQSNWVEFGQEMHSLDQLFENSMVKEK